MLFGLKVHCYEGATGGEEDDVLLWELGPFQVKTSLGRVSNDVLELHDRIVLELMRPLDVNATEHARLIGVGILVKAFQVEAITLTIDTGVRDHALIAVAKEVVSGGEVLASAALAKLGHQLSLSSLVFGIGINLLDLVLSVASLYLLVSEEGLNL